MQDFRSNMLVIFFDLDKMETGHSVYPIRLQHVDHSSDSAPFKHPHYFERRFPYNVNTAKIAHAIRTDIIHMLDMLFHEFLGLTNIEHINIDCIKIIVITEGFIP